MRQSRAVPDSILSSQVAPIGGYKGPFNNDDQSHADFCVRLMKPVVPLRFADGTPSGFNLTADILQPQPAGGVWCPAPGLARLDARELVPARNGERMLFHRGGWGFVGQDSGSAVHYGHILASDIDTSGLKFQRIDSVSGLPSVPRGKWIEARTLPWAGKGQAAGNGSACDGLSVSAMTVRVRSIPADMNYLSSRQTSSIPYAIYGDPSEDLGAREDRTRHIKYTLLEWSWINVRGGGVARALVKEGEKFFPCTDVPSIVLASVSDAQSKHHTGWVSAIYGAIPTADNGRLYGWMVSAHRHGGDPVIFHLTN